MGIWPFKKTDAAWDRLRSLIDQDDAAGMQSSLAEFGDVGRAVAHPEDAKRKGWTPLFHAAKYGSAAAVQELVRAGADVNSVDPNGRSAIYWAACNLNDEEAASIVLLMIELGGDVDAAAGDGRTPMFGAILNSNPEAVRAMLGAGASADAQLNDPGSGLSLYPLDVAAGQGGSEIVGMLAAHGAPYDEEITGIESDSSGDGNAYSYRLELVGGDAEVREKLEYLFDDCSWEMGLAVVDSSASEMGDRFAIEFTSEKQFDLDMETHEAGESDDNIVLAILGKQQLLSNLHAEVIDLGREPSHVELILTDPGMRRWRCELSKYGSLRPIDEG